MAEEIETNILEIMTKYMKNAEWGHLILKKVASGLLELDEYEDGAILNDKDFNVLNEFAEVF